ncbi:MAG: DoxX family protein [Cyclobacteriaceae bacterium]
MNSAISLYIMAGVYVLAGLLHFIRPKMYVGIIPPYLPYPRALVFISGFFEIGFGIGLLFETTRSVSAWGIILMLLAFLSVHIYMLQAEKFQKLPTWILWIRLPLQFVLMYWAYQFT